MIDLIDNIDDTRTTRCINQVQFIVKQHFDCLIDSGATSEQIKEVTVNFRRAIQAALGEAILSLLAQLKEKEDETN